MDLATGGLLLAGLTVVATTVTGLVAPWWARKTEREKWNNDREAEALRFQRQEEGRRIQRGEDAAKELIGVVDNAVTVMRSSGTYKQARLAPFHHEIRRLSLLLTDDDARDRMLEVASGLYFYEQAQEVERMLSHWTAASACAKASHDVLRAYLLGRPIPPTPRLARLSVLLEEGSDWLAVRLQEEGPDELDEPETTDVAPEGSRTE